METGVAWVEEIGCGTNEPGPYRDAAATASAVASKPAKWPLPAGPRTDRDWEDIITGRDGYPSRCAVRQKKIKRYKDSDDDG